MFTSVSLIVSPKSCYYHKCPTSMTTDYHKCPVSMMTDYHKCLMSMMTPIIASTAKYK